MFYCYSPSACKAGILFLPSEAKNNVRWYPTITMVLWRPELLQHPLHKYARYITLTGIRGAIPEHVCTGAFTRNAAITHMPSRKGHLLLTTSGSNVGGEEGWGVYAIFYSPHTRTNGHTPLHPGRHLWPTPSAPPSIPRPIAGTHRPGYRTCSPTLAARAHRRPSQVGRGEPCSAWAIPMVPMRGRGCR